MFIFRTFILAVMALSVVVSEIDVLDLKVCNGELEEILRRCFSTFSSTLTTSVKNAKNLTLRLWDIT